MSEFQLDTSGAVLIPTGIDAPGQTTHTVHAWRSLDAFTQGYVEALLRSMGLQYFGSGESDDTPRFVGFSDLAPETLATIIRDCAEYTAAPDDRTLGSWFWHNRQQGIIGPRPPLTPTVGSDGLIYLKETK